MLTAPRVYYAMARDELFFRTVGLVWSRTDAPVTAIVLQAITASAIALLGRYEQILNFIISVDFIFFTLTAASLLVLRARERGQPAAGIYRVPEHPCTTVAFVLGTAGVVAATVISYPGNAFTGLGIAAAGLPVYWYWSTRRNR
jgi:APA family basic amino acid/polyamine antiporter